MKRVTREWAKRAEKDWSAAQGVLLFRNPTQYELVCFLAQQCAEKYLKARLKEAGIAFEKTHDLFSLLSLALDVEPSWKTLIPQANALSGFAVEVRYPELSVTKARAKQALKDCDAIRLAVRTALDLPV